MRAQEAQPSDGKALLIEALKLARGMKGVEEIQLIVAVHNQAAVLLYERFGFAHVWTELRALKAAERYVDAHHMVLDMRDDTTNQTAISVARS